MPVNPLLIQQNPSQNYRRTLASTMAGQGLDTSPVGHPLQALARLAQAYAGKKMMGGIDEQQAARQQGAQQTLAEALAGYRGDVTQDFAVESEGPVQPGMPQPTENYPITTPGQGQDISALTRILANNPDTAHLANSLQLAQVEAGMKPQTTNLQEVYDPTSPTGTRLVNRAAAAGQPGKPGSGMDMQFDPKTGQLVRVSTGRKGVGDENELGKATMNKIEGKQIDAQESMARLDNIKALYEPRFQQVPVRMGMKWTSMKAKFNAGEIDPKDMGDLYDYALYKSTSFEHMSRLLNELSGAAVSVEEFNRLKQSLPNPGEGVFDGDDPISYQAKLDRAMQDTKRAIMRYKYMTALGKDAMSMPLWKIDDVINERGTELEQQYGNDEAGKLRVRQQLRQEFSM